jgi:hypothetical protein
MWTCTHMYSKQWLPLGDECPPDRSPSTLAIARAWGPSFFGAEECCLRPERGRVTGPSRREPFPPVARSADTLGTGMMMTHARTADRVPGFRSLHILVMWTATVGDSPAHRLRTGTVPSRQAFVVGSFIARCAARIGPVYTRRPDNWISITGRSPSARSFDILNPAGCIVPCGIGSAAVLAPCVNILDTFWLLKHGRMTWTSIERGVTRTVGPGRHKVVHLTTPARRGGGFRNVETKNIANLRHNYSKLVHVRDHLIKARPCWAILVTFNFVRVSVTLAARASVALQVDSRTCVATAKNVDFFFLRVSAVRVHHISGQIFALQRTRMKQG